MLQAKLACKYLEVFFSIFRKKGQSSCNNTHWTAARNSGKSAEKR